MCELKEKVVFLQGLAQGMEIDAESKEGKLITSMLEVMADMADAMAEMSDSLDEVFDYVDELDEDLRSMLTDSGVLLAGVRRLLEHEGYRHE